MTYIDKLVQRDPGFRVVGGHIHDVGALVDVLSTVHQKHAVLK